MTAERRQPPGRVSIGARALSSLATAIVAEAAGVASRRATVALQDRRGSIAARITVPALIGDETTLVDRAERIRDHLTWGLAQLADRRVAAVDVRFAGVAHRATARVR